MKKELLLLFILLSFTRISSAQKQDNGNYWHLNSNGKITWNYDGRSHYDHIEMSGKRMSVIIRYGINEAGNFICNRNMVWPMLRTIPNDTHASLLRHVGWNPLEYVTINHHSLNSNEEKVNNITLNGMMTINSHFSNVDVRHIICPSTDFPGLMESYSLKNSSKNKIKIEVDDCDLKMNTAQAEGTYGSYTVEERINETGVYTVASGDSISFSTFLCAYKNSETFPKWNTDNELLKRRSFINKIESNLILDTPDNVINSMFWFSKIRACESIYETKNGPMHGPGGGAYYAAIWANDEAEYINPFFPFVGYDYGLASAINSFNMYSKWINKKWEPVPSSIIAEGTDYWNGAGDEGDAAMLAYGAGRFALCFGDKAEAKKLWPLITWCLEYCRRNLNSQGVVESDADELEHRFPSGKANLNTSSLYYDALISASYLAKDLGIGISVAKNYKKQADDMNINIDKYFHSQVSGFDTYRYYDGNTLLRSWICIPLSMGIYTRSKGTIEALFSDKLWTNNGLLTQEGDKTFWDRSTLYALRGALMAGETDKTMNFLKYYSNTRLLGNHVPYAIEAWPEGEQRHLSAESALYARVITEGLFGIRPTGMHSFSILPRLPKEWNYMNLRHVRICNDDFDIYVNKKNGKVNISIKRGDKLISQKIVKGRIIVKL